ncbi:MAG TPA: hypothetical protein VFM90_02600, partial [Cyclobacteriaceae bacterium]|nr:hypothetical protein [Cyclobacteriaceae bacterium]
MKKLSILFFFFAVAYVPANALHAVLTHNIFRAPEANGLKPYVEVYWEIDPRSLLFDKKDGVWTGNIQTDIVIRKNNLPVIEEHYLLTTPPISDVNVLLSQRITQLKRFSLDTGFYTIEVALIDKIKNGKGYHYSGELHIPYTKEPLFSDIQLVDTLLPASGESIYQRNNQLQLPLFTNFVDDHRKHVRYYVELYHTEQASSAKYIRTFISKKEEGNL